MPHKNELFILAMQAKTIGSPETGTGCLMDVDIPQSEIIIGQRGMLEENRDYRQLIPYVVFKCGDRIAGYTRTEMSGDKRLHGKFAIGFGGHVDLADVVVDAKTRSIIDLKATLAGCAERELEEELVLDSATRIIGERVLDKKIVANTVPVDEVHIGVVVMVELSAEGLKANEDALHIEGFKTAQEWLDSGLTCETWTDLLLRELSERALE